ncbi:MAG: type II toxin-antitoxin system Phd/YefM family antitoxin [Kiritimatiellae bacterium]|nr:type II toxin-antitoxin system Phd/YefM family antitoxin [Kiritimatiellia bacterium]MDD4024735.1 type II toxin-antitoxin system Phd/YefM family antitoxin [Kiritimatiellia bacterium]
MNAIAANDLKTRGIRCVEQSMGEDGEAAITVHGKVRYMIVTPEKYDRLREAELDFAVREARLDVAQGKISATSIAEHLEQVKPCRAR